MGLTKMPLLLMSTMTIMYLLPVSDLVGNCPVWSEKIVYRTLYTVVNMSRCFVPLSVLVSQTSMRLECLDGGVRLPVASLLDQRDTIASSDVACSNQD